MAMHVIILRAVRSAGYLERLPLGYPRAPIDVESGGRISARRQLFDLNQPTEPVGLAEMQSPAACWNGRRHYQCVICGSAGRSPCCRCPLSVSPVRKAASSANSRPSASGKQFVRVFNRLRQHGGAIATRTTAMSLAFPARKSPRRRHTLDRCEDDAMSPAIPHANHPAADPCSTAPRRTAMSLAIRHANHPPATYARPLRGRPQ
jgi:hypothetical protein